MTYLGEGRILGLQSKIMIKRKEGFIMSFENGKMDSERDQRSEPCRVVDQWLLDTNIDKKLNKKRKKLKAMKKRLKKSHSVSKKERKKYARLKAECKKLRAEQREKEFEVRMQTQEMSFHYQKQLEKARLETCMYKMLLQISCSGKTNVGEMKGMLGLPEFLNGGDMDEL